MVLVNNRNQRIDFLRGAAILLVLLLHFHMSFNIQHTFLSLCMPATLLHRLTINGNYAVTMFYVISGYLITSSTLQRYKNLDSMKPLEFYKFRLAKIFPGLVLALIIVNIFSALAFKSFANKTETIPMWVTNISALTFWYNMLLQKNGGYFNYATTTFWSLSVEEAFYLFFPFACIITKRKSRLCLLASALIVFCMLFRYFHRDNELYYIYDYFGCLDAIAIGVLAAILKDTSYDIYFSNKFTQLLTVTALCITYLIGFRGNEVFGFTSISLTTAILILGSNKQIIAQTIPTKIINKSICFVGKISYELYLYHLIILGLLRDFFRKPELSFTEINNLFCIFMLLSLIVAFISHRFVTDPLNRKIRDFKLYHSGALDTPLKT